MPRVGQSRERRGPPGWYHHHRTHGDLRCQEHMLVWPGDLVAAAGTGWGLLLWLFLVAAGLCAVARSRGQAGAPAAPRRQARARTNELEAGKRRPMIGSGEQPPAGMRAWKRSLGWFPGSRVAGGVVSHAPIRRPACWRAAHDRVIRGPGCSVRSSSAAKPSHAITRARPGLATLPASWAHRRWPRRRVTPDHHRRLARTPRSARYRWTLAVSAREYRTAALRAVSSGRLATICS
jgi:hypothetical protein